jgi:hypothetical protein
VAGDQAILQELRSLNRTVGELTGYVRTIYLIVVVTVALNIIVGVLVGVNLLGES